MIRAGLQEELVTALINMDLYEKRKSIKKGGSSSSNDSKSGKDGDQAAGGCCAIL